MINSRKNRIRSNGEVILHLLADNKDSKKFQSKKLDFFETSKKNSLPAQDASSNAFCKGGDEEGVRTDYSAKNTKFDHFFNQQRYFKNNRSSTFLSFDGDQEKCGKECMEGMSNDSESSESLGSQQEYVDNEQSFSDDPEYEQPFYEYQSPENDYEVNMDGNSDSARSNGEYSKKEDYDAYEGRNEEEVTGGNDTKVELANKKNGSFGTVAKSSVEVDDNLRILKTKFDFLDPKSDIFVHWGVGTPTVGKNKCLITEPFTNTTDFPFANYRTPEALNISFNRVFSRISGNNFELKDTLDENMGILRAIKHQISIQKVVSIFYVSLMEKMVRLSILAVMTEVEEYGSTKEVGRFTKFFRDWCLFLIDECYPSLIEKNLSCPFSAEIISYRLLELLKNQLENESPYNDIISRLSPGHYFSQSVQWVIQIEKAISSANYARFFELIEHGQYLQSCLALKFLKNFIFKGFESRCIVKHAYPVSYLAKLFKFDNETSIIQFMKHSPKEREWAASLGTENNTMTFKCIDGDNYFFYGKNFLNSLVPKDYTLKQLIFDEIENTYLKLERSGVYRVSPPKDADWNSIDAVALKEFKLSDPFDLEKQKLIKSPKINYLVEKIQRDHFDQHAFESSHPACNVLDEKSTNQSQYFGNNRQIDSGGAELDIEPPTGCNDEGKGLVVNEDIVFGADIGEFKLHRDVSSRGYTPDTLNEPNSNFAISVDKKNFNNTVEKKNSNSDYNEVNVDHEEHVNYASKMDSDSMDDKFEESGDFITTTSHSKAPKSLEDKKGGGIENLNNKSEKNGIYDAYALKEIEELKKENLKMQNKLNLMEENEEKIFKFLEKILDKSTNIIKKDAIVENQKTEADSMSPAWEPVSFLDHLLTKISQLDEPGNNSDFHDVYWWKLMVSVDLSNYKYFSPEGWLCSKIFGTQKVDTKLERCKVWVSHKSSSNSRLEQKNFHIHFDILQAPDDFPELDSRDIANYNSLSSISSHKLDFFSNLKSDLSNTSAMIFHIGSPLIPLNEDLEKAKNVWLKPRITKLAFLLNFLPNNSHVPLLVLYSPDQNMWPRYEWPKNRKINFLKSFFQSMNLKKISRILICPLIEDDNASDEDACVDIDFDSSEKKLLEYIEWLIGFSNLSFDIRSINLKQFVDSKIESVTMDFQKAYETLFCKGRMRNELQLKRYAPGTKGINESGHGAVGLDQDAMMRFKSKYSDISEVDIYVDEVLTYFPLEWSSLVQVWNNSISQVIDTVVNPQFLLFSCPPCIEEVQELCLLPKNWNSKEQLQYLNDILNDFFVPESPEYPSLFLVEMDFFETLISAMPVNDFQFVVGKIRDLIGFHHNLAKVLKKRAMNNLLIPKPIPVPFYQILHVILHSLLEPLPDDLFVGIMKEDFRKFIKSKPTTTSQCLWDTGGRAEKIQVLYLKSCISIHEWNLSKQKKSYEINDDALFSPKDRAQKVLEHQKSPSLRVQNPDVSNHATPPIPHENSTRISQAPKNNQVIEKKIEFNDENFHELDKLLERTRRLKRTSKSHRVPKLGEDTSFDCADSHSSDSTINNNNKLIKNDD